MPKLHHRKARKDYPEAGVKRGDMYYTWSLMTGPRSSRTYRQIERPSRSQLTSSEFLSVLYDLQDRLSEMPMDDVGSLQDLASDIRDHGQEQRDKFDNLPEGLQQGSTGELLEERADAMDSWSDEIDSAAHDIEAHDPDDYDDEDEAASTYEDLWETAKNCEPSV